MQVKNIATSNPMAKSLGICPIDIDRDGLIDIIVANDTVQNFVFHNKGGGKFEEIGAMSDEEAQRHLDSELRPDEAAAA